MTRFQLSLEQLNVAVTDVVADVLRRAGVDPVRWTVNVQEGTQESDEFEDASDEYYDLEFSFYQDENSELNFLHLGLIAGVFRMTESEFTFQSLPHRIVGTAKDVSSSEIFDALSTRGGTIVYKCLQMDCTPTFDELLEYNDDNSCLVIRED